MSTTQKADAFKFTTNIPVQCIIRFVDVRPGKPFNDPHKGLITLPAQVSIKGSFDGIQTIAYLKGPVWKNVKALAEAGIVGGDHDTDALEAVTAPTSLPVLSGTVTATLAKGPKDKYENMVFTRVGQALPAQPKRLTPEQAASAPAHKGPLPTKPFDEPSEEEKRFAAFSAAVDEVEDPYENSGPIHPARVDPAQQVQKATPVRQDGAGTLNAASKALAVEGAYQDLWERTAAFQSKMAAEHQIPVDGASVQAHAATVWISLKDKGLA